MSSYLTVRCIVSYLHNTPQDTRERRQGMLYTKHWMMCDTYRGEHKAMVRTRSTTKDTELREQCLQDYNDTTIFSIASPDEKAVDTVSTSDDAVFQKKYIVIHHTATRNNLTAEEMKLSMQRSWVDNRGMPRIPTNYIVDKR